MLYLREKVRNYAKSYLRFMVGCFFKKMSVWESIKKPVQAFARCKNNSFGLGYIIA